MSNKYRPRLSYNEASVQTDNICDAMRLAAGPPDVRSPQQRLRDPAGAARNSLREMKRCQLAGDTGLAKYHARQIKLAHDEICPPGGAKPSAGKKPKRRASGATKNSARSRGPTHEPPTDDEVVAHLSAVARRAGLAAANTQRSSTAPRKRAASKDPVVARMLDIAQRSGLRLRDERANGRR